jgi:hypothetical protein
MTSSTLLHCILSAPTRPWCLAPTGSIGSAGGRYAEWCFVGSMGNHRRVSLAEGARGGGDSPNPFRPVIV